MSERMDNEPAEACWEALENVPRLPTYAMRALQQLKAEFWRARNRESNLDTGLYETRVALNRVLPPED